MNIAPNQVQPSPSVSALPGATAPPALNGGARCAVRKQPTAVAVSRSFDPQQALLTALFILSVTAFVSQLFAPRPIYGAGLTIDRLSAALTLLVTAVGAVIYRFSTRYLHGDPQRERFLSWLLFSVLSAYVLMLATNLLLLAVAWSLTSLGLHKLLTHYPERIEGMRAARKKFLISRLGDLALIGAIAAIWSNWGTLDLNRLFAITAVSGPTRGMTIVALLIVLAALTKSAQFPFHSWLPETMESPTPVSALMHAGIINAGGALLLRAAPLLIRVPEALLLLTVVGTVTAVLGSICMWAQIKVKRTLAWSTVSQMGFMMVQCGLGAFPAALLHIVAHGCYKAWSFLRSGDIPPAVSIARSSPSSALISAAAGIIIAIPAMAMAGRITGFYPLHSPGETALASILAISIGQMWVGLFGRPLPRRFAPAAIRVATATLATCGVTILAFALYQAANLYLSPVIGHLALPTGPVAWITACIPVGTLFVLTVGHALLPAYNRTAAGRAFRVHALHGFYFGAIADRFVDFVWRLPFLKGDVHARNM